MGELMRQKARRHKLPPPPVPSHFWNNKEHWRLALDELCVAYDRRCAFSTFRIEPVTGSRTVEHFQPKSKYPERAYDGTNFRLVCGLMNGRKRENEDVLDPFTIPADAFDIVPTSGEIMVHRNCPSGLRAMAQSTITRLKLDDGECNAHRLHHIKLFLTNSPRIEPADSPFVHHWLTQQGLL